MEERVQKARAAVLDYQNQQGLVSPQATVESLSSIVGVYQSQLTELQTQRNSLLGYLQPNAPEVVKLQDQMAAVEKLITTKTSTTGCTQRQNPQCHRRKYAPLASRS